MGLYEDVTNHEKINTLLETDGQTSSDMTHMTKFIGGGDMKAGLREIFNAGQNRGYQQGIIDGEENGFLKGIATSCIVSGFSILTFHFCKKRKLKKRLKEQKESLQENADDIITAISSVDEVVTVPQVEVATEEDAQETSTLSTHQDK